jgi:rhodanese-related sulfurtransferase
VGLLDFFRPVKTVSPGEVSRLLASPDTGGLQLVDVRQPFEFRRGHIPGARLLPLGRLKRRRAELDPARPIIVYCAHGSRSHAAASLLARSGFRNVRSMKGGLAAWQGELTKGPADSA